MPKVNEVQADITGKGEDLDQKSFADFGVSEAITSALAERDIVHPFPIQALTLPVALKRHDIIGQAKTAPERPSASASRCSKIPSAVTKKELG